LTFEKFPSASRRSAVVTFAALLALHLLDAVASGVEHRRGAIVRTEPEAALLLPA